jgi:tRNA (cytidine/uridine-2'-O-)-methyltransferase
MLMNGLPKFRITRVFLMSSHAQKSYLEIDFQDGDWLVLEKKARIK